MLRKTILEKDFKGISNNKMFLNEFFYYTYRRFNWMQPCQVIGGPTLETSIILDCLGLHPQLMKDYTFKILFFIQ